MNERKKYVENDAKTHFPVHLVFSRVNFDSQRVAEPSVLVSAPHLIKAFKRFRAYSQHL
jgi:hypothetical protein